MTPPQEHAPPTRKLMTPILSKMEFLYNKIRKMENQNVTESEKEALMESILALEEQVGESDPDIRALLQRTQRLMQRTNAGADEVSHVMESLTIEEQANATSAQPFDRPSASTAHMSSADELAEVERLQAEAARSDDDREKSATDGSNHQTSEESSSEHSRPEKLH